MTIRRLITTVLVLPVLLLGSLGVPAGPAAAQTAPQDAGHTPPRLSYLAGEVSFWRPGAEDWAPARLNMPLAPGDELFTTHGGNVELQVGPRAYVRTWGDTQVAVTAHTAGHLALSATSGYVAVDLRGLDAGDVVHLATPHGTLAIDRPGYYRADVGREATTFVARGPGHATLTPPGGAPLAVSAGQQLIVDAAGAVQTHGAPALDVWDRWNQTRTDSLLASVSAQHVPEGVYGAADLDRHGEWQAVQPYGSVWIPTTVATGWVPYSTGRWVWDPFYGWTWVDAAPWGWAPFHYGRWVLVGHRWAWAPGPRIVRPVYTPALVAFFGAPGIRVSVGVPLVSWVALGWGEPVVPWWGRPGFVGRPWWGGWGGPRVVNNVVINRTTIVNVNDIRVYRHAGTRRAVVGVRPDDFGRRAVDEARLADVDTRALEPVRGTLPGAPAPAARVGGNGRAVRPPASAARPAVAPRTSAPTRAPLAGPRDAAPSEAPRPSAGEADGRRESAPRAMPPAADRRREDAPDARVAPERREPGAPEPRSATPGAPGRRPDLQAPGRSDPGAPAPGERQPAPTVSPRGPLPGQGAGPAPRPVPPAARPTEPSTPGPTSPARRPTPTEDRRPEPPATTAPSSGGPVARPTPPAARPADPGGPARVAPAPPSGRPERPEPPAPAAPRSEPSVRPAPTARPAAEPAMRSLPAARPQPTPSLRPIPAARPESPAPARDAGPRLAPRTEPHAPATTGGARGVGAERAGGGRAPVADRPDRPRTGGQGKERGGR
jgi:hypothetical protein